MATGTGNLPNPTMSFSPFAILTAEEMNDLVENIESVADGTGIGDSAVTGMKIASYRMPYQTITTNTTETDLIMQSGWNFIQGTGGNTGNKTITFPSAFSSIKSVHVMPLGLHTALPAAIGDFTTAYSGNNNFIFAISITNTTFSARYTVDSSATLSSSLYAGFTWIAFGT